ncbi:uncharacterized protein BDZ99DRAFT_9157 [Mytilinidion resinicola]|uniref:Amidohydrolase-related domain-containing protein n=1 Tax=Mytilinidion resinicola TaxID=574789 RepID=A0A6A6Z7M9_9PEZI|nr:uncharacterized protein BDZ99DRAFT_9157 [Mytilinidion resinicola]KAF2817111.1 hypothetical protein BDZ99DRAFT_9157 [Mytilinidion resinicola]
MSGFIIRDVRVFTGESVVEHGYVHVQDGKIVSVGETSSLSSAIDVPTFTKPGHTLLPGLIDAHIHASMANPVALPQSLRFGCTTVCDMHNEYDNTEKLQKQMLEPDTAELKTSGQAATIDNGWPIPVITAHDKSPETAAEIATWPKLSTRENVIEYLETNKRNSNNDYVKLMNESGRSMGHDFSHPTKELQRIIVEEAHKLGYLTIAHATCVSDTLDVLKAGVDGLAHTICDQPPTQELVDAYKKDNAWLNPTLAAIGSLTTEGKELQEKFAHDDRVRGLIGEKEVGNMCECMAMTIPSAKVEYAYESVRMLRKAGIDIVCGSDAAGPALGTAWGLSMHHELYLLVNEVGMSPEEALRSATAVTAKRFRFNDRGRLVAGLKADLLLVEGNPLEKIDDTLNLRGVWRDGKLCSLYDGKL